MKQQVVSMLCIYAAIIYVTTAQSRYPRCPACRTCQKCKICRRCPDCPKAECITNPEIDMDILNTEVLKINSKLDQIKNNITGELIEALNSKLVEMRNAIKDELTKEINQNEDKLNALKTQLTKTTTEPSDCACEGQRQRSLIYFAGPYIYTFADAKAYCKSKGHKIATPFQLDVANVLELEESAWGWVDDGSIRYPMQMPNTNKWCGHGGVNTDLNRNRLDKFGVYCVTNGGPD